MRFVFLILLNLIILSLSFSVFAQDFQNKKQNPGQKRYLNLREKLFQDMQLFERTFQEDSDFLQLHQEMEKMMREQLKGALSDEEVNQLLNPQSFGNAFEQNESDLTPRSDGTFEWSETSQNRLLKIKIKMPADQPLDIKIAKNQIKVSGEMKSARGKNQFTRVITVPSDCDWTRARIETDKDGHAQVVLPKFKPSTKSIEQPKDGRQPVRPSDKGVAI